MAHEPFGWRPTTLLVSVRRYRCTGCGYGVTVYSRLPRCPMCGAEDAWEQLDFVRTFKDAFGDGLTLI